MSKAYINTHSAVPQAKPWVVPAQVFAGVSVQDRAEPTLTTSWPTLPQLTVGEGVSYITVFLAAPGLIYAGPPTASHTTDVAAWTARAIAYPPAWWPIAVNAGDVVAVRDL